MTHHSAGLAAGIASSDSNMARNWQVAARFASRHAISIVLIVEFVLFSLFAPDFFSVANLLNMAKAVAVLGIMSAGATIGLISGAMDLSVGSVLALSGVVAAWMLQVGLPAPLAVIACLGVGLVVGLTNGVVVTKLRVNPIITTLATMTVVRGISLLIFGPVGIPISDHWYRVFALSVGGMPMPVLALVVLYMLIFVVLTQTSFGKHIYAVGGNPSAARAAAIPVDRLRVVCLGISGLMAALAGFMLSSMAGAGVPSAGTGYELMALTAVVLGGCSIAGGAGTMQGTAIGVLIIGILMNGMAMAAIPAYYQTILQSCALLVAVLIDARRTGGYR